MKSAATTPTQYLATLPDERRAAMKAVRRLLRDNLDDGYEEGMQYGMISYHVPHRLYPAGYHVDPKQPLPFAALASQKQHMALYLMGLYADAETSRWFGAAWKKTGKKLDMGKSCLRFNKVDDLALDVLGEALRRLPVRRYIELVEANLPTKRRRA